MHDPEKYGPFKAMTFAEHTLRGEDEDDDANAPALVEVRSSISGSGAATEENAVYVGGYGAAYERLASLDHNSWDECVAGESELLEQKSYGDEQGVDTNAKDGTNGNMTENKAK